MFAKLTSKNQITLSKAVVSEVDAAEYFEVAVDNGRIVLTPVRSQRVQAEALITGDHAMLVLCHDFPGLSMTLDTCLGLAAGQPTMYHAKCL